MSRLVDPKKLKPHPERELVPPPSDAEYQGLKSDIRAQGILVPITCSEEVILDGHTRWEIAKELGLDEVPVTRLAARSEEEQLDILLGINVRRRQMNNDQKRTLAANVIKKWPEKSDRALASMTGLSHPFIGTVRADLELQGEVETTSTREGQDGVEQPATKPKKKAGKPAAKPKKEEPAPEPKGATDDPARHSSDAEDLPETGSEDESSEEPHDRGDPLRRVVTVEAWPYPGPEILEAGCSACGANPGDLCSDIETGESFDEAVHAARINAATDAREAKKDDGPGHRFAEVTKMVKKKLEGRSAPSVEELYQAAKKIEPKVGKLTLRQFNARFPLQIKRGQMPYVEDGGAEDAAPGSPERKALVEWCEEVALSAPPARKSPELVDLLGGEPLEDELCGMLVEVSRTLQTLVTISRRLRSGGKPQDAEDEPAPEPAGAGA